MDAVKTRGDEKSGLEARKVYIKAQLDLYKEGLEEEKWERDSFQALEAKLHLDSQNPKTQLKQLGQILSTFVNKD